MRLPLSPAVSHENELYNTNSPSTIYSPITIVRNYPYMCVCVAYSSLASNPGSLFRILSRSYGEIFLQSCKTKSGIPKLRDKIQNGNPGFKAKSSHSYYLRVAFILLRAPDCPVIYYLRAATIQRNMLLSSTKFIWFDNIFTSNQELGSSNKNKP